MNQPIESKGSCLCGSVSFHAKSMATQVGACHCNMCRKWSGGPFLAVDCKNDIEFSGIENISIFESSEWAERGFCSKCGTHLFYRLKQSKQHFVPAGLCDTETNLHFDHQIFIDEKPEYYTFANETTNMTGEEAFELFSAD